MCGIVGLVDRSGIGLAAGAVEAALFSLRRRGPDDVGLWRDPKVLFGHRRLSVVDPSPAGHQPMESCDGRYVIVLNGEIYNHIDLRHQLDPAIAWRSTSDTETLLEAYRRWGADCLKRLNGMFAFAVWDRSEQTLFLARDRIGVKPLYYSLSNGRIAFASRPAAMTALLGQESFPIDPEALRVYLELGFIPAPLSFHQGIHEMPPGHYLLASAKGARLMRYWDFRSIPAEPGWLSRAEDDLVDELDALIQSAVRLRLISDVPLGAFLSGGVDSAFVVSAMRTAGVAHPRAFTIGFEEKAFDEGPDAARMAAHLGVSLTQETLSVDSLLDLMPTYVEQFDEPFADSSAFPTMAVARLARRDVTVALSGDGADELFGGYHYYPLIERLAPWIRGRRRLSRGAARLLQSVPAHRAKLLAGALRSANVVSLFHYLRGIGKDYQSLVSADLGASTADSLSWYEQFAAGFAVDLSAAETGMRLDEGLTLPDMYLQKTDLATMAFSLEARCPMTDYRLVEWAMRLPLQFKIRHGETKYLLKKALCRRVPAEVVHRPKKGFAMPVARWLRGPLRSWAEGLIYDETLMSRLPLDKHAVRALLQGQLNRERETHPLVWSVLMLLCYVDRERYLQSASAVPSTAAA
ncbi:MAG TPA: asparagine synthase (glutamine-hydrolyzing) [Stellaceae bacterium]|nr:asparagine synthase (glutamine-hydrolyzing) [Stellaceae bacterium]